MDLAKEVSGIPASKETILQNALKKMKEGWENIKLTFLSYKDKNLSILTSTRDIQALVDDQQVKTAAMKSSSLIGPFKEEISQWHVKLGHLSDMIDSWLAVQAVWMYLDPIFSCENLRKQLPKEGKMFAEVDETWRSIVGNAVRNPEAMAVLSQKNIVEKLQQLKCMLDDIEKGLNNYLELKRQLFPRFFFISNDDLLEVLSVTDDPLQVQPHLRKCFDGIDRLSFTPDKIITGMESAQNEIVEFCNKIAPEDAEGQVEKLLLMVQDEMKMGIREAFLKAVESYGKDPRKEWVQQHPGQIVLAASQVHWTAEVTQAIEAGQLGPYVQQCMKQIEELVQLVRGSLSKNARTTLEALITLDVHAKDVVRKLQDMRVKSPSDFHWLAQLRSYHQEGNFILQLVNTKVAYGYEYLGNTPRLVITPLTDRAYITLMSAVALNLGGAPQGPAGTGKTETVKDLAKALGKMCVIISCSDTIDYQCTGKIFKGIVQSGAWCCYDEFNRIDIEVISIIAQQIQTIQKAVGERVKTFMFEGSEMKLDPSCGIFVTMNPGYAGRTELPDNLKVMFRPVAMMVPDYALIAEICLYTSGFSDAGNLARKVVGVFKNCSEQLSSQDHYDYGMRAVKAVVTKSNSLKRTCPEQGEDVLVVRAIQYVCQARLVGDDIPLFEGIMSDMFPGTQAPETDLKDLEAAIVKNIEKRNLQAVPYFVKKILQMYTTLQTRHGMMILGDPLGGKTTAYKILADSITDLNRKGLMDESKVEYRIISPKAVTLEELYGSFDPMSQEWTDGILNRNFRWQANSTTDHRQWLVLDGPVDALWVENLNTLLDDNKRLCLANGEQISLGKKQSILFEAQDCRVASPAFVSRTGMVYMDPAELGWQAVFKSWLQQTVPGEITPEQKENIKMLFDWLVPPTLSFVQKSCQQLVKCEPMHLVMSMLKLYSCLIEDIKQSGKEVSNLLIGQFLFSLVWSVGGALNENSRIRFDKFFRDLCQLEGAKTTHVKPEKLKLSSELMIPKTGLIYDYCCLPKSTGMWNNWASLVSPTAIDDTMKINELIVNTSETERQKFFLDLLTRHNKPLLLVGATGTGKSLVTKKFLSALPADKFVSSSINFSARTTARQAQCVVTSKLERRKVGVYGPAPGKQLVVFVDDLNMPAKDVYGAQPPIEVLRQWVDHGFWYDSETSRIQELVDTSLLCAMGTPGGGRTVMSPRFTRHFNVISMLPFSEETMKNIFTPIMDWHFNSFDADHKKWSKVIISATLQIYKKAMDNLLPTPSKPHYVFNLRDIARVVQGVLLLKSRVVPAGQAGTQKIVRLWIHEMYREFYDKLVEDSDRQFFFQTVKSCAEAEFKEKFNNLFSNVTGDVTDDNMRTLMFGDYLSNSKQERPYDEIQNLEQLKKTAEKYFEDYRKMGKADVDLFPFGYAMEHVSRISRVLKQSNGHCLLVGVAGSGRRSCAKLAAFISGLDLVSIEMTQSYSISDWREQIRKLMRKAGVEGTPTVFLLADNQIKNETFLDDINMILNSGDVPNLFDIKERQEITEKMTVLCQKERWAIKQTPQSMYNKFIERVRCNLHLVLTFSSVGEGFRNRIRMFPSVANCCNTIWFKAWPADALESVADRHLADVKLNKEVKAGTIAMLKHFHESVTRLSERFCDTTGRYNYVTPASYIKLIKTFKNLLNKKLTLKNNYQAGLEKVAFLEKQKVGEKSEKAKKILTALGGEKDRWSQSIKELTSTTENAIGDLLLSAGVIAYLGPFFPSYREDCLKDWYGMLKNKGIPVSEKFSLSETLGNAAKTQDWQVAGLPFDNYSVDSAVVAMGSNSWPLIIDPQGLANRWIKNMENAKKLEVIKLSEPNYIRRLENCIQFGNPCLLESIGEELDPVLEPVLLKQTFKQDGIDCIRIGDHVIEYNPEFTLYMTTKLSNPRYSPEVSVKVTLLNFGMTPEGLERHLTAVVAASESPELKQRKDMLVDGAKKKLQLAEIDDKILNMLSKSEGNILEEEKVVEMLSSSKALASEIMEKQKIASKVEKEIHDVTDRYQPVARHASALFFTISDLVKIDPMYQYSLTWFIHLLHQSIQNSKPAAKLEERIANLNSHFTYSIYKNVCRSLFEKDKLLFSFLLCIGIQKAEGKVDETEWQFLVTGGVSVKSPSPNPASQWLSDKSWAQLVRCSDLPALKGLSDHVTQNGSVWQKIYNSSTPETEKLPEPWNSKLNRLEKLIILRCLRSDKMVSAVQNFIKEEMGQQYIEPLPFDLSLSYEDSSSSTPLIYIISRGSDPMAEISRFAEKKGMGQDKIRTMSLGQGQGPAAERMILEAAEGGTWVVLQNCHLHRSWMGSLERIYENVIANPSRTKSTFRLWLTSCPTPEFPAIILQNGVKMINEPENSLKANLLRSWQSEPISDPAFLASSKKPKVFEKLLFGLSFFHAMIQERAKYGALGQNIPYEFVEADFQTSARQLKIFIDDNEAVPFEALNYLTGDSNYGGRVTDDKDRRLVISLLKNYYCPEAVNNENYKFSASGTYFAPSKGNYQDYVQYIKSLPAVAQPEVFGLHENANIVKDEIKTQALLGGVLLTLPKQMTVGGKSPLEFVGQLASDILSKLPQDFNMEEVQVKYPLSYKDAISIVMVQELIRFNRLIGVIRESLQNVGKAVKGLVVMTRELKDVVDSLLVGKVPLMWLRKSYPSLKPLASYITDLLARLAYFSDWIKNGMPNVIWLSGLYFPQALLTALLQNHARQNKMPVSQLELEFEVMDSDRAMASKPSTGAYIRGLYMEGARWCREKKQVAESRPNVLYDLVPVIWLKPVEKGKLEPRKGYNCPVYKTSARKGVLSTTGHSTNFVMFIKFPTDQPESHWINRGAACLCQLDN